MQEAGSDTWPTGQSSGHFVFANHLNRDALHARIPYTRRGRLHARVARRLEALHGDKVDEVANELALHFPVGGRVSARHPLAGPCGPPPHREAATHLTQALELLRDGNGLGLGEQVRTPYTSIESQELLSCSLFHQGRFREALRSARAALSIFEPDTEDAISASLGMNAGVGSHYWEGIAL